MNLLATWMLPLALCVPHGGQYLPPAADPDNPAPTDGIVAQPGLGPEIVFSASRWEWWYDFNQEALLALRSRLQARAATAGQQAFQPLTADDRAGVVLPALVDALRKRPPVAGERRDLNPRDVRAAAVLALGRLQRPEAVAFIELVVESDPDLFVRTQGLLALGFTGSPAAVETLARIYADDRESAEVRSYAVAGLALVGNTQAVDILLKALPEKALKSLNNQLRAATVFAAGLCGTASLGAPLRALAGTWLFEKDADLRALVAVALGRIDDPASAPFLLAQLDDPDNQVRRSAAAALGATSARLDDDSLRRMIGRLGSDADQPTRLNLLRALGAARRDIAREYLRGTMATATYEYKPHVAMALALDGDPGNAAPLLAALASEHERSTLASMAVALGVLQASSAAPPLLRLLETERDPMMQGYLCLALGLIAPAQPDLVARIRALVRQSHDVELIRSGIMALGLLGDRQGLDALAADVRTLHSTVNRAAILHGLGLVGDRQTLLPILDVLHDETQPSYVRTYALQALGELSDPRPLSPAWRLSSNVELNHDVGFLFEMYRVL